LSATGHPGSSSPGDSLTRVLERVTVTSYLAPLREGGSLPGLVEADNLGTYVLKFRGAGQGPLALVAEIIAGELARALGLRTPELALADLDPRIAATSPSTSCRAPPGSTRLAGPWTRTSPASCCGSTR
jgi:hypothetical protein